MSAVTDRSPVALRPESAVMSTWDPKAPLTVSVLCPVFNHVDYIDEAIVGFMRQETVFPFEVVVRDDASSDGTSEKLTEYAAAYPHILRHELLSENQYAQGVRVLPSLIEAANGEYLAICDGDDYWLSNDKLQKQVDAIRSTPGAIASCHRTSVVGATGKGALAERWWIDWQDRDLLQQSDLISTKTPFHSSSFLVEATAVRDFTADFVGRMVSEDLMLYMLAAARGKIVRLDHEMSAYRRHEGGVTSTSDHRQRKTLLQSRIAMWTQLKEVANGNLPLIEDLVRHLEARLAKIEKRDALVKSTRESMHKPSAYPAILFRRSFWREVFRSSRA